MGEARHNILVIFEQQRKMNQSFQNGQLLDTVRILDFSEELNTDYFSLLKR